MKFLKSVFKRLLKHGSKEQKKNKLRPAGTESALIRWRVGSAGKSSLQKPHWRRAYPTLNPSRAGAWLCHVPLIRAGCAGKRTTGWFDSGRGLLAATLPPIHFHFPFLKPKFSNLEVANSNAFDWALYV